MAKSDTAVKAENQAAQAQVTPEAPVADLGVLGTPLASYSADSDPVVIERTKGIGINKQTLDASYAIFKAPLAKYDANLDPVVAERNKA